MRFWFSILLLAGLSACAASGQDPRYQFGVSAAQPVGTTSTSHYTEQDLLAWKASQICTTGYSVLRQDGLPAEEGGRIIDNHIQCQVYRPSLDVLDISWATMF